MSTLEENEVNMACLFSEEDKKVIISILEKIQEDNA
jgi:hypothetical protein